MKKPGLLLAAAVILVTNAIVLAGVARNRAGTPVETIQLTERELPLSSRGKEDTGVSLRLNWIQYLPGSMDTSSWLNETKLKSLGFDTAAILRDSKHQPLPRPAFVAFDYNGPAWEQWLQKSREPRLYDANNADMQSRLLAIDAATTPEPLFRKYSDRQKYLIVRAVIQVFGNSWDPITLKPGRIRLQASVSQLLPDGVHVPLPFAEAFRNLAPGSGAASSRYTLTLAYGRRFEPWVVTR